MRKLTHLVECLSDSYITLIKKYYHQKPSRERGRRLELFEYALENGKSFEVKSPSSFSHLQDRLKQDIFEILLSNSYKDASISDYNHAYIDIKKNVALARLLYSKGNTSDALKLLYKQINQAKDFELFGELLLVQNPIRNILAIRKDKESEKWSQEIQYAYRMYGELLKAEEIYYKVIMDGLMHSENKEVLLHKEDIDRLRRVYRETNSARIALLYYVTAIRYFEQLRNFKHAIKLSEEFYKKITDSKCLNVPANISRIELELSKFFLHTGDYIQSYKYALGAYDQTNKKMLETIRVLKQLYLTSLHSENYPKAQKYLQEGYKCLKSENIEYVDEMWSLFEVCYWFKKKKYSKAEQQLKKMDLVELRKDKQGWAIGLYYIDILLSLEVGDSDKAAHKTERLSRHLSRLKTKPKRVVSILNILKELVQSGLDYKKTQKNKKALFYKLNKNKDDYYWNPSGYELIQFNHWYAQKLL